MAPSSSLSDFLLQAQRMLTQGIVDRSMRSSMGSSIAISRRPISPSLCPSLPW